MRGGCHSSVTDSAAFSSSRTVIRHAASRASSGNCQAQLSCCCVRLCDSPRSDRRLTASLTIGAVTSPAISQATHACSSSGPESMLAVELRLTFSLAFLRKFQQPKPLVRCRPRLCNGSTKPARVARSAARLFTQRLRGSTYSPAHPRLPLFAVSIAAV